VEPVKNLEDHLIEEVRVSTRRGAVGHFSKNDALNAVEFSGQDELAEHAVDLVGLCPYVFEEEELAFSLRSVRGAKRGREKSEAASIQNVLDSLGIFSGLEDAEAFRGADFDEASGEGSLQAGVVDSVVAAEVSGDERAVEGGESGLVEEPALDSGEVAVGDERLGIGADEIEVEAVKQIVGAVTAARGEDGANFGIGKGGVEIGEAIGGGCGKIRRGLAGGVVAGGRVVAAGAQGGDFLRD